VSEAIKRLTRSTAVTIHIPRIILSARVAILKASDHREPVDLTSIGRNDPRIVLLPRYNPRDITPVRDPGEDQWWNKVAFTQDATLEAERLSLDGSSQVADIQSNGQSDIPFSSSDPTPDRSNPTTDRSDPTPDRSVPTTDRSNPTPDRSDPTTDRSNPTPDRSVPTSDRSNPTPDQSDLTTDLPGPTTDRSDSTTSRSEEGGRKRGQSVLVSEERKGRKRVRGLAARDDQFYKVDGTDVSKPDIRS
jgi:hypothetical protein